MCGAAARCEECGKGGLLVGVIGNAHDLHRLPDMRILEALVVKRRPPAISMSEMVEVAKLPWGEQMGRVVG
jgi:hypothetical protein